MLNKQQIRDKCWELRSKYWKLYTRDIINYNKWRKARQRREFIEKIYNNVK